MKCYRKPRHVTDLRRIDGQILLAEGEVTGHHHCVVSDDVIGGPIPDAQWFEEPSGRRVLLVLHRCRLEHEEHGTITLDPEQPVQVRQGDVLLTPIGRGAWAVTRQVEYSPTAIRSVRD